VGEKVNYVRFADDFCITGASREVLEHEVKPLVEAFLKERGLEFSPEKTVITHIDDGFDFLGQRVRKYHGMMLIMPSKKNTQALLAKVRQIIQGNKQATAGHLIALLNPLLRGWANYHRHVVSKATFRRVDATVFNALWRWTRRRHPRKRARWVMKKYFCTIGACRWVFFGELDSRHGDYPVYLFRTQDTPIERHVRVREGANPYDPVWEEYFEQRLDLKMVKDLHGRRALLALWLEQDGRCPHCQQKITKETGWESHHLIWRSKGGQNTRENRVLLHPNCHKAVHSQGLTVEKPCPPARAQREA
jgi:RNA-directed DNA polymerase